jgi:hypothetical protein
MTGATVNPKVYVRLLPHPATPDFYLPQYPRIVVEVIDMP